MGLDSLLQRVKDAIYGDDDNMYRHGDRGGLIGQIENLFGDHQRRQGSYDNPLPSSEDPYGDPADSGRGQFRNVRPASEDPYGDPADVGR